MAASEDDGRARWIVFGDTSPFLNQQLLSDPRAAQHILELATLWPLFLKDLALLGIVLAILFQASLFVIVSAVVVVVLGATLSNEVHEDYWRFISRGESGFDERSFNLALLKSQTLMTGDWQIIRPSGTLGARLTVPKGNTVVFGLIKEQLQLGEITLHGCKRLGSFLVDGVYLMDAQACKVDGSAEILVGDEIAAAALRVRVDDSQLILILDQNFLGQRSPPENRIWLEKILTDNSSK